MADDAIDQPAPDEGHTQQMADLSSLEFQAASEDYEPSNDAMAGQHEAAEQPDMSTGELCSSLLMIGFNLVASRRGQHWQLSPDEATETGNALGAVLDKYFPDLSNQGVEITAVMTVGMVLTPRLMADKQQAEAEERQRVEAERREKQQQGGDGGDQSEHAA